ncbi:hypothetical protein AZZ62_004109, partial [Klebsiella variicola]
ASSTVNGRTRRWRRWPEGSAPRPGRRRRLPAASTRPRSAAANPR